MGLMDLQPSTPLDQNINAINENFRRIDDENRTKIIKNGTVPQILFGYQKDGFGTGTDYGLKVSKPGQDVTTNGVNGVGNANLIFNSAYNTFKIVATGTLSLTTADISSVPNADTKIATFVHNLGFVPVIVASASNTSVYEPIPRFNLYDFTNGANGYEAFEKWSVWSDTTTLTVTRLNTWITRGVPPGAAVYQSASTYTIRYYLLQETAN